MLGDPAHLRQDYDAGALDEASAEKDPFRQFERWFGEALKADMIEPNAMTLATIDDRGRPRARMVLLKGMDGRGFTFFTNFESAKGRELDAHPFAALVFWWDKLQRQVRIEGRIERVETRESDDYFSTRPHGSRIGALASPQSRVIASRDELAKRVAELEKQYPEEVPRPEHWGGYRVLPDLFEFWQGRRSRLHDRLRYTPEGEAWRIDRLAP